MADFFTLDEVLKELQLDKDELNQMISEGELRAYRSESKMKFKKEDIESLKKTRSTKPTVELPVTEKEETILDIDIENVILPAKKPEVKEEPIVEEVKEQKHEGDSTLLFDDINIMAEETFVSDAELPIPTDLDIAEATVGTGEITMTVEHEISKVTMPVSPKKTVAKKKAGPVVVPPTVEAEIERRRPSVIWTFVLILTFATLAFTGFFVYDLLRNENGKAEKPMGVTKGTAQWFLEKFYTDPNWVGVYKSRYPAELDQKKLSRYDNITFDKPDEPGSDGKTEEAAK